MLSGLSSFTRLPSIPSFSRSLYLSSAPSGTLQDNSQTGSHCSWDSRCPCRSALPLVGSGIGRCVGELGVHGLGLVMSALIMSPHHHTHLSLMADDEGVCVVGASGFLLHPLPSVRPVPHGFLSRGSTPLAPRSAASAAPDRQRVIATASTPRSGFGRAGGG